MQLFNPEIAPFRFAGAFVGFFAGASDCAVFNLALRRAEYKLDVPAVLARMADNARSCWWQRIFGGDEIRKFLVLITQRAAFQLAVLRCAFDALRKMTPVACGGHGARAMMRAWWKEG